MPLRHTKMSAGCRSLAANGQMNTCRSSCDPLREIGIGGKRGHVKAVLAGEGTDELFAGYAYYHACVDRPRELADELTRSLNTMHNIDPQRVDRITWPKVWKRGRPFSTAN